MWNIEKTWMRWSSRPKWTIRSQNLQLENKMHVSVSSKNWNRCLEEGFLRPAGLKKLFYQIRGKITIQSAAIDITITYIVVNDSIVHKLDQFTPTTEKELVRIIRNCPTQTCSLDHEKLGCVYAVTLTAMSILLLREGNFQVLVILKWEMDYVDFFSTKQMLPWHI